MVPLSCSSCRQDWPDPWHPRENLSWPKFKHVVNLRFWLTLTQCIQGIYDIGAVAPAEMQGFYTALGFEKDRWDSRGLFVRGCSMYLDASVCLYGGEKAW